VVALPDNEVSFSLTGSGAEVKVVNILGLSALKHKGDLPYFEVPALAGIGGIQHGFLTRKGGVSLPPYQSLNLSHDNGDRDEHVFENRVRIATGFGFESNRLVLLNQMHQDRILVVREPFETAAVRLEYDALITDTPHTVLGIRTADCLPVFIADPRKKIIAAVHAGRQGTALHITVHVLRKMKEAFGCRPHDLLVAMGPSIGPCCYEIDEKVFMPEWSPFAAAKPDGKWMLDLGKINIAQMGAEGIRKEQISWIDLCTHCHDGLFFSYRREGKTGRQLSFIGIV
jgi:polyphenol oxidase